jgi:molybdate transport system substrate-binding protein
MTAIFHLMSGGAAAAVVKHVQARFEAECNLQLQGTYSAVGQMRDQLLGGAPCDLIILTRALIDQLEQSGHVLAGSSRSLGKVRTGIAVRSGEKHPAVQNADQLREALANARGIYFPDPQKATAGIHFMKVLGQLGLEQACQAALRPFPNGATAMAEMARSTESGLIGCTQVTEINYTDGVDLVDVLPAEFELSTDYVLGICAGTHHLAQARAMSDLLTGEASAGIRRKGGFEF